MIQIAISEQAYNAMAALHPPGTALEAPQRLADGRPLVWLPTAMVKALRPYRDAGEDWSDVIVRFIAQHHAGE
jgi:hypothetical protein